MGLFNIFKSNNQNNKATTANGVLGPTYLEKFTEHFDNPKNLQSHEWRRMISNKGQKKFKIKYYGQLHEKYNNLIVETDFSRPLIFAVDIVSNQEILLWDGCKYGYDAIFCDNYTNEQIDNRKVETIYTDSNGKDTFEIRISTYNQFDFDNEMGEEVDENGFLEVESGGKIKFDEAKRNGFDCLIINVTNEDGITTEIVSEELA
jgi:hypothetical protein